MKQDEVGYRVVKKPIDGVAQGAPDNQSEPERCEPRIGAGKPDPKQHHSGHLEGQQGPLSERALLLEQPIAYALVPDQDEIKKRCQPHRHPGADVNNV